MPAGELIVGNDRLEINLTFSGAGGGQETSQKRSDLWRSVILQ
jgi:hypothetical protein